MFPTNLWTSHPGHAGLNEISPKVLLLKKFSRRARRVRKEKQKPLAVANAMARQAEVYGVLTCEDQCNLQEKGPW